MSVIGKTVFSFALIVLYNTRYSNCAQNYRPNKYNAEPDDQGVRGKIVHDRIILMMRGYYIESDNKIKGLDHMRFMYEETGYYESGYVVGEIIERFRKMVFIAKRQTTAKYDSLLKHFKELEKMQMLYMELYHLVMMMHEIPKKYKNLPADRVADRMPTSSEELLSPADIERIKQAQILAEIEKRNKDREERKRKKILEQLEEINKILAGQKVSAKKKDYNKWWPIDYGWEIDYYW